MAAVHFKKIIVFGLGVSLGFSMIACGTKKSVAKGSQELVTTGQREAQRERERQAQLKAKRAASELDKTSSKSSDEAVTSTSDKANKSDSSKIQLTLVQPGELTPEEQQRFSRPVLTRSDANLEGLIYTGSADDTLVSELQTRLASTGTEADRARNQDFAREIGLVQVRHNTPSQGFVTVTALLQREGRRRHYELVGQMRNDFTATIGDATKAPYIKIDLVCLDLNGGCNNMRLKFVDEKDVKAKRIAYVVARSTPAWQMIRGRDDTTDNAEYNKLISIFQNSGARYTNPRLSAVNTVTDLVLNTSETINGSATFVVGLKVLLGGTTSGIPQEQIITWAGPLVSTDNGATFDVGVSNDYGPFLVSESKPMIDTEYPYLTDSIRQTLLTANDGKGNITLAVKIRANVPLASEQTFTLEVHRQQRPVRYLGL